MPPKARSLLNCAAHSRFTSQKSCERCKPRNVAKQIPRLIREIWRRPQTCNAKNLEQCSTLLSSATPKNRAEELKIWKRNFHASEPKSKRAAPKPRIGARLQRMRCDWKTSTLARLMKRWRASEHTKNVCKLKAKSSSALKKRIDD